MQNEQLDQFQSWFDEYVSGFYQDDEFVNAHIRLKETHSRQVVGQMSYLVDQLNLDEPKGNLAKTVALFHDVGRFEQFKLYRTYNDQRSIDHAALGLKILRKFDLLAPLEPAQRKMVEKAIAVHNKKNLPAGLDGHTQLLAKLIRDADKIDIFRVIITEHMKFKQDPENFHLELEFPDTPGFSQPVFQGVLNRRPVDYRLLTNWNDMRLLQIGWIYDINFPAALARLKDSGYLETMFGFMPAGPQLEQVKKQAFEYIDQVLNSNK